MIATSPRPAEVEPGQADAVARLRLIQLQHSDDPLAASVATAATLLLSRLDRLIEAQERAA